MPGMLATHDWKGPQPGGRGGVRHPFGQWTTWFDGLSLTHEHDGTTVIHSPVVDQAALHGLLRRVRDLGLPLLSVVRLEPG